MKLLYSSKILTFLLCLTSVTCLAQTSISGNIKDENDEGLAGVNIIVKGRVIGTVTDLNGDFNLTVNENPPITLVISFVGYATQEHKINDLTTSNLNIKMEEATLLGQEIVVSASRVEEKIMESPVSIEKMDILAVQATPSDNYYKGLANLKGVDVTTSSINFQIINTRGFGSTGNTRFVQLTDGMDTQAPALNFPIGNLNGPSELDVESVELIPGASSALYGPNAFNGILLVNSKNAFDYQGLSAFVKAGLNHIGDPDAAASPTWEGAIRYAKSFRNKFAFKVNVAYMQALDWYGTSDFDREIARTPQGFSFNPGADKLHYMGDEASINLGFLNYAAQNAYAFEGTPQDSPTLGSLRAAFNGILGASAANQGVGITEYLPYVPGHTVSRTPYREQDLIDYNAKNLKANVGFYYRINDKIELSYLNNYGAGTSIYTGAQRYSLRNFSIDQHRLQLRGDNFFVRAYATLENSGDSYITEFLGIKVGESWESNNGYFAKYTAHYLNYFAGTNLNGGTVGLNLSPTDIPGLSASQLLTAQQAAHTYARSQVDGARNAPGGPLYEQEKEKQRNGGTIPKGPRFNDRSGLYHAESQYDFKNEITVMELQAGASFRMYNLNSNGTIFNDSLEDIKIKEYGIYMQAGKWLGDRKVKISGSGRYDKNQNFKGRFNPRISVLVKLNETSNIRASFQTGFRIPSTQGQYIDLNTISSRLLGGLQGAVDKYNIFRTADGTNTNLTFDRFSVENYTKKVFDAGAKPTDINNDAYKADLRPLEWEPVKPESVQNIEVGYKNLINNKFLIDVVYYYNIYHDFITQKGVRIANQFTSNPALQNEPGYTYNPNTALNGTVNYASLLNGNAFYIDPLGKIKGNTGSLYTNYDKQITSQGFAGGLTYNLARGYSIGGNYNWNVILNAPPKDEFLAEFNTPEHKVNLNFGNRKVTDNLGFNVTMRWQSEFEWQSSFTAPAQGMVPSYTTVDAQLNYKISSIKSVIKIGGSNLLNQRYIQSLGGPTIGALYYVSLTFDELMR
jgi:outer membrane receptor protein involved in Fe transport